MQAAEVSLTQVGEYEFHVRIDGAAMGELTTDEPRVRQGVEVRMRVLDPAGVALPMRTA